MVKQIIAIVQYTPNASDYFGNQLRGQELIYRIRMNFTVKVDRTQWITVELGGAPTTINAFYNGFLNNFCMHEDYVYMSLLLMGHIV